MPLEAKMTLTMTYTKRGRTITKRGLATTTDAQIAYIEAREASGLGGSKFGAADLADHTGTTVARISYNGRLWPAEEWFPGQAPLAEAPKMPRFDYENACPACGPTCEC
jgi:hypothetical protein